MASYLVVMYVVSSMLFNAIKLSGGAQLRMATSPNQEMKTVDAIKRTRP